MYLLTVHSYRSSHLPSDIRNDSEMASFIVKGDDEQWSNALVKDGSIVQIKVNGNSMNSKRRHDKSDRGEEASNRKRKKTSKMKNEKKPREKR